MAGTAGMTRDDLKRAVCEAIDRQGNAIIVAGESERAIGDRNRGVINPPVLDFEPPGPVLHEV